MSSREILFSAAGASGVTPTYIEDVFSTYLYTGTSATQTITNNIDLSGKGGIVWTKSRSNTSNQYLVYSDGSTLYGLYPNLTNAQGAAAPPSGHVFNNNGFTIDGSSGLFNFSGYTYASWTFREQAKFFDIVTGTGGATFNHSLGVTPGMIIIKLTNGTSDWWTVHRSSNGYFYLNSTAAAAGTGTPGIASSGAWVNANSTTFRTANFVSSGESFVAYLFAHDAGGFGVAGTDNVISCGSVVTTSGFATVNLGYEPQFVLIKPSSAAQAWWITDNMRGMSNSATTLLRANTSQADYNDGSTYIIPNATGFSVNETMFGTGVTCIYMAIRRGPMKTPTSGTTVFQPLRYAGNNTNGRVISTGKTFPTDWLLTFDTENGASGSGTSYNSPDITRLTGFEVNPPYLRTNSTNAESAAVNTITLNNSNFDYTVGSSSGQLNSTGANYTNWNIGRAPGFFDVVCYTGNGTNGQAYNHNLGVTPELVIIKRRDSTGSWLVNSRQLLVDDYLTLNSTNASAFGGYLISNNATTFTISDGLPNTSSATYVAYLFATVAGVSKVGSYTGTGSTQTINAGLPTGARFVLIKRTDSTGNWWAWDTATGMVAGNDTRIAINATASIINTNWVYTATNGFQIVTTDASVNANGGSYIYLAIA